MRLKPGVLVGGIKSEAIVIILAMMEACNEVGSPLIVTSVLDSHTSGLHPKGYAVDFRLRAEHGIWGVSRWSELASKLSEALGERVEPVKTERQVIWRGQQFDTVLELKSPPGATNWAPHIHCEFDPKSEVKDVDIIEVKDVDSGDGRESGD